MTKASIYKKDLERFKRGSLDNEPYLCEPKDDPDYVNVWIITANEMYEMMEHMDDLMKSQKWNDKLIQDLQKRLIQYEKQ